MVRPMEESGCCHSPTSEGPLQQHSLGEEGEFLRESPMSTPPPPTGKHDRTSPQSDDTEVIVKRLRPGDMQPPDHMEVNQEFTQHPSVNMQPAAPSPVRTIPAQRQ